MKKLTLPINSPMLSSNFTYGVATASFQIEGGAQDRLPCIWDTFCATPGKIADHSDGLKACEHYTLWQDDIELINSLNVDAYRLSISWPRVITIDGKINQTGIQYYLNIIEALNAKNIKVFATLYHWDLPQHLEDNGGWLNRETAYKFAEYVDLVTNILGDKVHTYTTLNEPFCSSFLGYEAGIHAPGLTGQANGRQAAHYLLLAHGLAMQVLTKNCPNSLKGIVLNFTPAYPASNSAKDINASNFADDYYNHWYAEPILNGKYPTIIEQLPIENRPDIQPGDMDIISHPIDYLGINFYTRMVYKAHESEIFEELAPEAPLTDIGWTIYPQAFTELLTSLNERYTLPPIYITENGAAMQDLMSNNKVNDIERISYYQSHLNAVDEAINSGVDIRGYFAWSLMDNFEWAEGYLKRFGIVYVDYDSQQRTIKASGYAYRDLLNQRGVNEI